MVKNQKAGARESQARAFAGTSKGRSKRGRENGSGLASLNNFGGL